MPSVKCNNYSSRYSFKSERRYKRGPGVSTCMRVCVHASLRVGVSVCRCVGVSVCWLVCELGCLFYLHVVSMLLRVLVRLFVILMVVFPRKTRKAFILLTDKVASARHWTGNDVIERES